MPQRWAPNISASPAAHTVGMTDKDITIPEQALDFAVHRNIARRSRPIRETCGSGSRPSCRRRWRACRVRGRGWPCIVGIGERFGVLRCATCRPKRYGAASASADPPRRRAMPAVDQRERVGAGVRCGERSVDPSPSRHRPPGKGLGEMRKDGIGRTGREHDGQSRGLVSEAFSSANATSSILAGWLR